MRDAALPDAGEPSPSTPALWPALYATSLCAALERCYGHADLLTDALTGRDCVALNENTLRNGELQYLPDSVAAGRVLWRPEELADCMTDIENLGCDARSQRLPASCQLLIVGTVEVGEDCALDEECAGRAFCDRETPATCPGTCAPLRPEGEDCNNNDDDQCENGLVCFRGTETCEPLGALGDTCGDGLPACKPGLLCRGQGQGEECVAFDTVYFRRVGEECMRGGALCAPGLVCESTSGNDGVCAQKVGEDESCKRAIPNQCPVTQYCPATDPGETGTCTDYPGDGEPCIADGRTQTCADGTTCIAGTCRARVDVGEPCMAAGQCWSGACGGDGQCTAPPMCNVD
jgi:hypothetical protein